MVHQRSSSSLMTATDDLADLKLFIRPPKPWCSCSLARFFIFSNNLHFSRTPFFCISCHNQKLAPNVYSLLFNLLIFSFPAFLLVDFLLYMTLDFSSPTISSISPKTYVFGPFRLASLSLPTVSSAIHVVATIAALVSHSRFVFRMLVLYVKLIHLFFYFVHGGFI
jgi:hypothetical protein